MRVTILLSNDIITRMGHPPYVIIVFPSKKGNITFGQTPFTSSQILFGSD